MSQNASQEHALQLRNLVKRLFEAAYNSNLESFKNIAIEFTQKSYNINLATSNEKEATNDDSTLNATSTLEASNLEKASNEKFFDEKASNEKASNVEKDLLLGTIGAIRDGNGASLLHISSYGCNISVIKWLLSKCPNMLALLDNKGQSPLFYAIQNQNPLQLEVISILLPHFDINKCDYEGNSLLHMAIKHDSVETIKFLLKNGCNINTASNSFDTPINMAVTTENMEIIKLLIDFGADLNTRFCNASVPPLVYSSALGNLNLVKFLIENGCKLDDVDSNGWSALHSAAEYGHFEIVKLLISFGANVNYVNNNATPYHLSLNSKNHELINYLKDQTDSKYTQTEYNPISIPEAIALSSKTRLECKELITAKHWNKAKSTYLQTIKDIQHLAQNESVKHELAILFSNLSIVCLSLNESNESLDAGLKSIKHNPKWIKGHYRTALAYKALKDEVNYLCHLYEAAKLEGENGPLWKEFTTNAEKIRNQKNN